MGSSNVCPKKPTMHWPLGVSRQEADPVTPKRGANLIVLELYTVKEAVAASKSEYLAWVQSNQSGWKAAPVEC